MTDRNLYSYARFSFSGQKESSIERQVESAQRYADSINKPITFIEADKGISAYTGKNIEKGALGDFIRKIQTGEINGSTVRLVIENIDRFSRQASKDSYKAFVDLIDTHNIEIMIIEDGYMLYTSESDVYDRIRIQISMERANQESKRKSMLISEAWQRRIKKIKSGEKKYSNSAIRPSWLGWDDQKQDFTVSDDTRSKIVYIFKLALEGLGPKAIVTRLMLEDITPVIGDKWTLSWVNLVLYNEAVKGVYQQYHGHGLKPHREKNGEPVDDYFPRIIDDETFNAVQVIRGSRRKSFGRPAIKSRNLFQGLVKCQCCGASMRVKVYSKKKYFICVSKVERGDCDNANVRYEILENAFFHVWEKHHIADMLTKSNTKVTQLQQRLTKIEAVLINNQNEQKELAKAISKKMSDVLLNLLSEKEEEAKQLNNEKAQLQLQINDNNTDTPNFKNIDFEKLTPSERQDITLRLRKLIDKIEVRNIKHSKFRLDHYIDTTFKNGEYMQIHVDQVGEIKYLKS